MLLELTTKASHLLTMKVQVSVTFHKEKYLSYYQSYLNKFSSRMMTLLSELSPLCVRALISLPHIIASSTLMHPYNQSFICGLPIQLASIVIYDEFYIANTLPVVPFHFLFINSKTVECPYKLCISSSLSVHVTR